MSGKDRQSKAKQAAERFRIWLHKRFLAGKFLCDSCLYDYGNVCRRPERPNATKCPEYKPR